MVKSRSERSKPDPESRRYRVAGRLVVKAGRKVRQAMGKVQKQARTKTWRTRKWRMQKAGERENRWLTWKHTRRTGTERQETQG
jgi:hypothetical protein